MTRPQRLGALAVCLSALVSQGQPTYSQGLSAKTWVGRHQEIEEYLRTAGCVTMQKFEMGATRCVLPPGGPIARMAWRLIPPGVYRGFWTSFKADLAAYELDKLLKMDMVPPTVDRQLEGNVGSAQQWVEDVRDLKSAPMPPESARAVWEKQQARMMMFDNLIGNRGRDSANVLVDAAWNFILIDHARAFRPDPELRHRVSPVDAELWEKMQGLTRAQLDARLGAWLDENEIAGIINRRERMKAEIDRLVAERGAAAVFLR
jgi:hypothetical protein